MKIDHESWETIRGLVSSLPILFCSGRPQPFVEAVASLLGVSLPCLCEWGGVLYDPSDYSTRVNPALSRDYLRSISLANSNFTELGFNVQPKMTALTLYVDTLRTVNDLLTDVKRFLEQIGLERVTTIRTGEDHIDVTHVAMSKAVGVRWLAELTKVPFANMIAIGDDSTDLPVFALVGWTGCPMNAVEAIKEKADYVSDFRDTSGVVDILAKMLSLE